MQMIVAICLAAALPTIALLIGIVMEQKGNKDAVLELRKIRAQLKCIADKLEIASS